MFRVGNKRGITIAEVFVAMGLFVVVSTLLVGIFNKTFRISAQESVNLELEQSCHFLLHQIESALTDSGTSGISYLSDPDYEGVAIDPIDDVTSEGTLAWQGEQLFFFWARPSQRFFKEAITTSNSSLSNPIRFTSSELLARASTDSPKRVAIGNGVTNFKVTNRQTDGTDRLIDISIELERTLPNNEPKRARFDKVVTILN